MTTILGIAALGGICLVVMFVITCLIAFSQSQVGTDEWKKRNRIE